MQYSAASFPAATRRFSSKRTPTGCTTSAAYHTHRRRRPGGSGPRRGPRGLPAASSSAATSGSTVIRSRERLVIWAEGGEGETSSSLAVLFSAVEPSADFVHIGASPFKAAGCGGIEGDGPPLLAYFRCMLWVSWSFTFFVCSVDCFPLRFSWLAGVRVLRSLPHGNGHPGPRGGPTAELRNGPPGPRGARRSLRRLPPLRQVPATRHDHCFVRRKCGWRHWNRPCSKPRK